MPVEAKSDALATSTPNLHEVIKQDAQSNKLTRLAAFTPTNLSEAMALAKLIATSDLAPKDYKRNPGNVLIAMQLGAELGVAPMQAIQNIAVINGRPAVWGDLALALVQSHPDYEWHKEWSEGTDDKKTAYFQVKRRNQDVSLNKFSVLDAKKAGLWQKAGPWQAYPDRMLQMRARGFGLRDRFADALKGLRLAEEAMDMPSEKVRDTGRMQVSEMATTSAITQSQEPNRGHGNEGTQIEKGPPKKENVLCGECGETNGHTADCKYAKATNQAPTEDAPPETGDPHPAEAPMEAEESSTSKGPTRRQLARMFAMAKEHSVPEGDLKTFIAENYNLTTSKDLSQEQYEQVCAWIEKQF